jgi:hypothetical protein
MAAGAGAPPATTSAVADAAGAASGTTDGHETALRQPPVTDGLDQPVAGVDLPAADAGGLAAIGRIASMGEASPTVASAADPARSMPAGEARTSGSAAVRSVDRLAPAATMTNRAAPAGSIEPAAVPPMPRQPRAAEPAATPPSPSSAGASGGGGASPFAAYLSVLALLGISLHMWALALSRAVRRPAPAYAPPVPPA